MDDTLWCWCPDQIELFAMEEPMDSVHVPTRVSGTTTIRGGEVRFDYVACMTCPRVEHSILGEVAAPWNKAHPDPVPATASQDVPDASTVRQ